MLLRMFVMGAMCCVKFSQVDSLMVLWFIQIKCFNEYSVGKGRKGTLRMEANIFSLE